VPTITGCRCRNDAIAPRAPDTVAARSYRSVRKAGPGEQNFGAHRQDCRGETSYLGHAISSLHRSQTTLKVDAVAKRSARPVDVLVGQNIRLCRLQQGLSQTELGQRIGLTFQQIQKYEKGANRVGASRLTQIADALRIPLGTLFDGRPTDARADHDLLPGALLADPHSLRLLQAFDTIGDKKRQTAILQLVDAVGGAVPRGGRSRNGGDHSR
jgi:transcriptional regulator with XRE-family HTH domain